MTGADPNQTRLRAAEAIAREAGVRARVLIACRPGVKNALILVAAIERIVL
jgi:hypothetical protein